MSELYSPHYAHPKGALVEVPGVGITFAHGTTVPTDATSGFASGCIFLHTDGSSGSQFYINEGTSTSCDFNALGLGGGDLSGLLATAAELNRAADLSTRIVNVTASTLGVTLADHDGKTVTLNRAAGIAVTMPAATGTGARFRFFIGTTVTSTNVITFTRAGSDTFFGHILQLADGGDTVNAYELPGSTVITLGTSSNTTGGTKGDFIEFEDVASATWWVRGITTAAGTEATPVT